MIHIVTDSTADLPKKVVEEYGIHVVPLTVHFGDEEFQDGVNLSTEEFYERLASSPVMPRTSQPSAAAFAQVYEEISQPGDTILSFHISSSLSGTHQSALLAARQFDDRQIEVVDTRLVSMALGMVVMRAAGAKNRGLDAEEILAECQRAAGATQVIFVVDTLDYLQKNGRIGKAQALVGGLLNVKPILMLEDGVVAPLEKIRGSAKARRRLIEKAQTLVPPDTVDEVALLHAAAEDQATAVAEQLRAAFPSVNFHIAELGPTVGAHAGPGTVGVAIVGR